MRKGEKKRKNEKFVDEKLSDQQCIKRTGIRKKQKEKTDLCIAIWQSPPLGDFRSSIYIYN